jgi:hypothetical protein
MHAIRVRVGLFPRKSECRYVLMYFLVFHFSACCCYFLFELRRCASVFVFFCFHKCLLRVFLGKCFDDFAFCFLTFWAMMMWSQQFCNSCPLGAVPLANRTSCTNCTIGSYAVSGFSACRNCSAGYFGTSDAASTCYDCSAGRHTPLAGLTRCEVCEAGRFSLNAQSTCTQWY